MKYIKRKYIVTLIVPEPRVPSLSEAESALESAAFSLRNVAYARVAFLEGNESAYEIPDVTREDDDALARVLEAIAESRQ